MKMQRVVSAVLALSMMMGSLYVPVAQAALIGTEQVVSTVAQRQSADEARQHLATMLAREDVTAQLQQYGVDVEQARSRVAGLSDDEVMRLNGQIDQMPAGGDVVGVVVFIFLVLLLTDILGFTDIFPFVKKTAR